MPAIDTYAALVPTAAGPAQRKACQDVGIVEAAEVVDHIIPPRLKEALDSGDAGRIERAKRLFWDRNNWQALSKRCHDRKTAREDSTFAARGCR